MEKLRIVYFGTPEFAASQLEAIINAGYEVAAVVTMPDKPAGRGKKIQFSEVKKVALDHQLPLLQPEKLKSLDFLDQLASFHANLFVVVAFRMLPAVVWQMPQLGTFNLHASLLPQYRGAAPINFAIINGETETGLTTFFLNEEIDKGTIIMREKTPIRHDETAGELHDKLMTMGNRIVVETLKKIESGTCETQPQDELTQGINLKTAPKITKEFCQLRFDRNCENTYNLVRGLSPYPAAHTRLCSANDEVVEMKVYEASVELTTPHVCPGTVVTDNKTYLKIALTDGFLLLNSLQQAGKKRMEVTDFLRGTPLFGTWKAC